MPVASFDGVSMWEYLCESQAAGVCACERELMCRVCVVSPGVSDVNSALSARFSTLPAAVKRARPSFPPPRGLISFFILSAIQLDFLWGHRGRGPFKYIGVSGVCVHTHKHTLCEQTDFPETALGRERLQVVHKMHRCVIWNKTSVLRRTQLCDQPGFIVFI